MAKKGKKSTPPGLDHLFKRHIINEAEYRSFWPAWWEATTDDERQELIEFYSGDEEEEEEKPKKHYAPTKVRKTAEKQAREIGGYVVRRNSKGQFSKRGKIFQAIRRKR